MKVSTIIARANEFTGFSSWKKEGYLAKYLTQFVEEKKVNEVSELLKEINLSFGSSVCRILLSASRDMSIDMAKVFIEDSKNRPEIYASLGFSPAYVIMHHSNFYDEDDREWIFQEALLSFNRPGVISKISFGQVNWTGLLDKYEKFDPVKNIPWESAKDSNRILQLLLGAKTETTRAVLKTILPRFSADDLIAVLVSCLEAPRRNVRLHEGERQTERQIKNLPLLYDRIQEMNFAPLDLSKIFQSLGENSRL